MDIKTSGIPPSPAERAAVDALLGQATSRWQGGNRDDARDGRTALGGRAVTTERDLLLPALHAVQDRIGWISQAALDYICERLTVPPAEAWGVVTFYDLLATAPQPPVVAHVCDDLACRRHGAEKLCTDLAAALGDAGEPSHVDGRVTWKRSPCLGQCDRAPAVLVLAASTEGRRSELLAPVAEVSAVVGALTALATHPSAGHRATDLTAPIHVAPVDPGKRRLLRRVGHVDPESLTAYRASAGYAGFARALALGRAGVIAEVTASKLQGRGGAAFPTGRKWEAVSRAAGRPRYVVCNADESEPGTFKDRVLLEADPFAIVEAMTIAGYAVDATRGYLYIRGEYPLAEERFSGAVAAARGAGLLGADVAGSGWAFDIEVRRGAGAYICGEETALFNSLEGKRGEPRSKPPFPVDVGLFGMPTVVNNVETLANVPWILREGGAAFAAIGTPVSTGSKLFCLSGDVARPGLYEVPFGATLGDLLTLAGGVRGGRELQAVLLGGAAGVFVGPEALAMPLTFEATRAAGATLGSGVVLVYDDTADLADALARIAEFFRHESCGQCVPCRIGTVRQAELLARLRTADAASRRGELALYRELAQAMRDASICGLGQTAASAIESALARFDPYPPGAAP